MLSRFCLVNQLPLLLTFVVDLEKHSVEGGLLTDEFALHLVDAGTSTHDHAAAEENLSDEDRYQNIGIHHILLILFFFCR